MAQTFLGRPCSNELLVELTNALSRAYERSHVALYTVAIPEQDFAGGIILVDLVEGWVDKVAISGGDGRAHPLLERRAQVLVGQRPLSRATLERQSALIQSIPGLTVDSRMENPESDDSVVLLLIPRQKKVEAAFGINNRGSRRLGQTIVQGGVDLYSTLVDGDRISASAYATTNLRNYRAFDVGYSVPLTASGLTLSATAGQIETKARVQRIRGKARFAALNLTYPLVRRSNLAVDAGVALDGVNSDNALFGSIFTTERTRAIRLVGGLAAAWGKTDLKSAVVLSHGLSILGARTGGNDSKGDFFKGNFVAQLEHRFTGRAIGRLSLLGQYSPDRLPGTELFSLGGPIIGRGFDTAFVSADRAAGGIAEAAYRPLAAKDFETSELYAFVDGARATINRRTGTPAESFGLASAGLGARLRYTDRLELGVEGAKVLERPAFYRRGSRLSLYFAILF